MDIAWFQNYGDHFNFICWVRGYTHTFNSCIEKGNQQVYAVRKHSSMIAAVDLFVIVIDLLANLISVFV